MTRYGPTLRPSDHTLLHYGCSQRYIASVTDMFDPFALPALPEIHLARSPLVRVVAQVRYPIDFSLVTPAKVGAIQERLRDRYPVLRSEAQVVFVADPSGIGLKPGGGNIWKFHDQSGDWSVSLSTDFVALDSKRYQSRTDFLTRLDEIVQALSAVSAPASCDRLGLRYINRLHGPSLDRLGDLLRPEVLGLGTAVAQGRLGHSICESLFEDGDVALSTRWGALRAGVTTDPSSMDPIDEPSWILDLDMFRGRSRPFAAESIRRDASAFAEKIHSLFRWCVTEPFLQEFRSPQ